MNVPSPLPNQMLVADPTSPLPAEVSSDEEIPLGWECANPALQIDCWMRDDTSLNK